MTLPPSRHSFRSWSIVALLLSTATAIAQVPAKCLEIEGVLVDACNNACSGAEEGENEMFRFMTGPSPIALGQLNAMWATPNTFLGWVQNATTASLTAQLNATITNCGWLIEPPNGIIPAGKRVLGITSTNMCVAGNSFAALSDTLYVIYQSPGNIMGHFKNTNNTNAITNFPSGTQSFRTFILSVPGLCSDSVTYNIAQLVNQMGTYGGGWVENDGSSLTVSWPGAPVVGYVNYGCQAPIIPLVADITTVPQPVPCGGTLSLQAVATGNISSVFWTGGTGSFSTPSSTSTTYTLGTGDSGGAVLSFCVISACGDTICDQVQVPVEAAPAPSITADPAPIPCGGSVGLAGTVNGTATNIFWTGGTGTFIPSTGTSTTYTPGSTESGIVQLSFCAVSSCGDTVCDPVLLEISGVPTPTITAGGPTTICEGGSVELTATGATSYAWSTGANTSAITVSSAGTYTVTANNACGYGTAEITIAVTAAPVAALSGPVTACPSENFTLEATGGDSYTWSTGATGSSIIATGPGTYTVTANSSCGSDQASWTVAPGDSYTPQFTIDTPIGCAPLCVTLTATDLGEATYTWSADGALIGLGPTLEYCFSAGTPDIALTVDANGYGDLCPGTYAMVDAIEVLPIPVARFVASPPITTIEAPTVTFMDQSTGATVRNWDFGTGEFGTETLISYTYDSVACYTVHLIVANELGCSDSTSMEVCVEDPFVIWVPNAFTPNSDEINDGFQVVTSVAEPTLFEMSIYDRWGAVIFTTSDVREAWKGEGAPLGVYVWKVRMKDTAGQDRQATGHVTLVR
jgi:gliding motility-associated-like protein